MTSPTSDRASSTPSETTNITVSGPNTNRLANIPRPTRSVFPNAICYYGDDGVKRHKYIARGMYETASRHFMEKNWAELDKLPDYTGQGYTEEDYTYLPGAADQPEEQPVALGELSLEDNQPANADTSEPQEKKDTSNA